MDTIFVISQLLALCGLVSIRMFLPVFLYCFAMRLILAHPNWTLIPEVIRQQAQNIPEWQTNAYFLIVLGILAALELAAVRNPDIKEFLIEDFDRYAKPIVSILLSFGVVNSVQMMEIQELFDGTAMVQTASFGGIAITIPAILAIAAGWATWFLCRIRSAALLIIQTIDPENDLGLQSLSNYVGEIALLITFFVLVILPPLALGLTIIGMLIGIYLQRLQTKYEQRHSHSCAACAATGKETSVSDCALICPKCGTEQSNIRRVNWFGLSGTSPLGNMSREQHAFRLLAAHRCRWCASPLNRVHVCPRCGREQWTDEMRTFYVRQTDLLCNRLALLALLGTWFGLFALILFRPLVIRPLSVHLSAGNRFLIGLVMMFLKLLILLPLVILSLLPFIAPLPLLIRYYFVKSRFFHALERTKEMRNEDTEEGKIAASLNL